LQQFKGADQTPNEEDLELQNRLPDEGRLEPSILRISQSDADIPNG
jgi:hypothetical protein